MKAAFMPPAKRARDPVESPKLPTSFDPNVVLADPRRTRHRTPTSLGRGTVDDGFAARDAQVGARFDRAVALEDSEDHRYAGNSMSRLITNLRDRTHRERCSSHCRLIVTAHEDDRGRWTGFFLSRAGRLRACRQYRGGSHCDEADVTCQHLDSFDL
jgi:hypothetical protein